MIILPVSHLDHDLTAAHVAWITLHFSDRDGFFLETVELPPELPPVTCALHGPLVGDPPVPESEVSYRRRGDRPDSRLCAREPRPTRLLTAWPRASSWRRPGPSGRSTLCQPELCYLPVRPRVAPSAAGGQRPCPSALTGRCRWAANGRTPDLAVRALRRASREPEGRTRLNRHCARGRLFSVYRACVAPATPRRSCASGGSRRDRSSGGRRRR